MRAPTGRRRDWPRHWAYCLEGLKGEALEAELQKCPAHLRGQVRYLVRVYLPAMAIHARVAEHHRRDNDG